MKISKESKIVIIFFVIYFCFAWVLTANYFYTHEKYIISGWWDTWHEQIKIGERGMVGDSNQFRLASFWLAEGTSRVFGVPVYAAYLTDRFIFTFLMFCVFYLFLLKWFDHRGAFLGTTILAAITPITYLPFIQESDYILQFLFLIGLWIIRDGKWIGLFILIFIATFAKETIVFIIPFYFLYNWNNKNKLKIIIKSVIMVLIWAGAYYITRYLFFDGDNSSIWQLPHNIEAIKSYFKFMPFLNITLSWIPLFGVMWVLAFWDIKKKPRYLATTAPFIIIFMILHFIMGWPEETRIILPLAFLVIPSAMLSINYILQQENKNPTIV